MQRILLLSACLLLQTPAGLVLAADATVREDSPAEYLVVEGDTLWDIAGRFLEEPWLWPQVWQENPQIDNPHLIYPGDRIRLSYVDGRPVLSLQRGGNGGSASSSPGPSGLREVRLSPQVRRQPLASPIPAIPLDVVSAFLDRKRIVAESELEAAPYLLANRQGTLLSGERDVIFARGDWAQGVTGYDVLRAGPVFQDPETGEVLGVEAELVGEASLLSREEDRASLRVDRSKLELRQGDRLVPRAPSVIDATYFPEAPGFPLNGRILDIGEGLAYGGLRDSLVLNLGEEDGLVSGHLLNLRKPDYLVEDPRSGETLSYPGEVFGSVLIYRVFDKTSLGLVLDSNGPIRLDDSVVTP